MVAYKQLPDAAQSGIRNLHATPPQRCKSKSMTAQRWWDAAMITVSVLLTLLVTVLDQPVDGSELGVVVVVASILACYFAWGRRYLNGTGSVPGLLYAGVLLLSLAVGIGFDPNFSFMQVVAFPTLWVVARSMRQAIALNMLAILPVTIGYTVFFGPAGLPGGIGVGVLSAAFSLALGSWISGVERAGEERSRLLDELLAVQDQLAAANREAGVDSERGRLAREIHDTIAQSLTGLVMVAQRAHADLERASDADDDHSSEHLVRATADVELIEAMARDALTEARGLVAAISPVRVESTLVDALVRLAQRFERETGVVVTTELDGLNGATKQSAVPSAELEVVLLRCAQEALANVRKHAQASRATVAVIRDGGRITLIVSDDGIGPVRSRMGASGSVYAPGRGDDAVEVARSVSGFGLAGMSDRLALVGGAVRLDAAQPQGSVLTVTIPIDSKPDASANTSPRDPTSTAIAAGTATEKEVPE